MNLYDTLNKIFYYDMSLGELRQMNSSKLYRNVTYNSLLYLDIIDYSEQCTITYLAQALGVSKPAATAKVNELIRQGLVVKTPSDTDRRVNYLAISPELLDEYKACDRVLYGAVQEIEATYTPEEIETFKGMLGVISHHYLTTRKDPQNE